MHPRPQLWLAVCRPVPHRAGLARWRRAYTASADAALDVTAQVEAVTRRPAKFIADYLTPMRAHLLTTTLSDLLVPACESASKEKRNCTSSSSISAVVQQPAPSLPQGHHLVYFPLQTAPSALAPDGADADHGPGDPFVRRMWAGGEVVFAPGAHESLLLDGRAVSCEESIERTRIRGGPGAEKVFVDVRRRYGLGHDRDAMQTLVDETRTLVFMRTEPPSPQGQTPPTRRPIQYPSSPSYAARITPRPAHLFHFSALTFNAHAIHLDRQYAMGTDGHRGLLVHGPLTLALMLRVLADYAGPAAGRVARIAYRNYAPLYVDDEMRVCVRRQQDRPAIWDVWVEGPGGGLAVKGTAEMASL
ncbi:hypothetical protein DCS_03962 [Drechmeria coniospora]|uniref:Uncharacterized protein n=1 Tax=Drechmeria coniospora TaxID=98403 RepID=A0A151GIN7_DRECN|nr:hypothetical protein DCS_03962 [Drechmeria coniospora]KYK56956.1 hypothetical protein DCS_03962 [Drechmeria coniospora]ODA80427.1 hypothetical protein RJ55_03385 [Drechmeria coniospora]